MSETPHRTRHGLPVHRRAIDHLPDHSAYARFNKRVALAVTTWVGSMTCAWFFCLLALLSLPAVLTQAFHVRWFPGWLVAVGLIALVAWIAQTFLQLVLLSVIMVGQNVQQTASDARAVKTFEDAELIADRLDTHTQGGITEILAAVGKSGDEIAALAGAVREAMAARAEQDSTVAADAKAARTAAEAAFVACQALAAVAVAKPGAGGGGSSSTAGVGGGGSGGGSGGQPGVKFTVT